MALSMRVTLSSGIVVEQAYLRINAINGNKNGAEISIEAFASKENCDTGNTPATYFNVPFTPLSNEDSPRWDKQAYEYLKTLEEFAGAADC